MACARRQHDGMEQRLGAGGAPALAARTQGGVRSRPHGDAADILDHPQGGSHLDDATTRHGRRPGPAQPARPARRRRKYQHYPAPRRRRHSDHSAPQKRREAMMNSSARHPCHRSGSALIAVLWLVAIPSMAAIVTLRVVSFDMEISTSRIHGFLAKLQAENGIAIGSNPAVKPDDPLLHHAGENGDAYDVRIIPEGARFNINALVLRGDKALLRSIFINWGLSQDDADTVADSLGDWVDSDDDVSLRGAEKDWYLQQGRINQPFNRPFYNLDEVRLV